MKTIFFLFLLAQAAGLHAQEPAGILPPGKDFSNRTADTLFLLPKQKLESLMEREEIMTELIMTLESRSSACDSALRVATLEANYWYRTLLETDELLKNAEMQNARKDRARKAFRRISFAAGVVAGVVLGGFI